MRKASDSQKGSSVRRRSKTVAHRSHHLHTSLGTCKVSNRVRIIIVSRIESKLATQSCVPERTWRGLILATAKDWNIAIAVREHWDWAAGALRLVGETTPKYPWLQITHTVGQNPSDRSKYQKQQLPQLVSVMPERGSAVRYCALMAVAERGKCKCSWKTKCNSRICYCQVAQTGAPCQKTAVHPKNTKLNFHGGK